MREAIPGTARTEEEKEQRKEGMKAFFSQGEDEDQNNPGPLFKDQPERARTLHHTRMIDNTGLQALGHRMWMLAIKKPSCQPYESTRSARPRRCSTLVR